MSINGLPKELLCEIFFLAIYPQTASTDRCRLMLVCQLWQECVDSSALLWADISAQGSHAYVRRVLEKSKASMINLKYHSNSRTNIDLESFMAEVSPHIARWRSLALTIRQPPESWESALSQLTTAQAPRLESLELKLIVRNHSGFGNAITLFNGAPAPASLKHLTLYRFKVAIEPLGLSGLVSLDLIHMSSISTPQLLEILRNSPWLQILNLDDNPGLVGLGSQLSAIPPLVLPKLTSLKLVWIDGEGANCILSKIRIPNRRKVYLCADISEGARPVLFTPTILHILHSTITATDHQFSDIQVDVYHNDELTIQARGMTLELYVDGEDQIEEVLSWIAEGLRSEAAACPVRLKIIGSDVDPVRLVAVPCPLVIKHLSLSGSLLQLLLQSPRVAIFQPPGPTCPGRLLADIGSLSIDVNTPKSQKEFITMLKARYEEPLTGTEIEPRCPVSLKSVELKGQPRAEGLVEEIIRIIGEVNVFWSN
ncbi:hypothetical protein FRC01_009259 [Tulasnella sp. 417]|nr:hypothetical protein FRC01_009259 [Tulasnella sp. 417]